MSEFVDATHVFGIFWVGFRRRGLGGLEGNPRNQGTLPFFLTGCDIDLGTDVVLDSFQGRPVSAPIFEMARV